MATNFSQFFFWKRTGIASCVLKFEGKKPKIVDFFLMANFLWSFFSEPKIHSQNWTSGCHFEKKEVNLRMPLLNLRMPLSKWHPEVQFLEWFLGSKKNDHQKLAIRKKSTILGFLPSNFNTKLATLVGFQEKKIGSNWLPFTPRN